MVSLQEVISYLEKYFPQRLAYDWDNVGLQIGSPSAKIDTILLTVDVTKEVIDEAKSVSAQLIISHHPLIFQALKKIRDDNQDGAIIFDAIKSGINIYTMHTNADISCHGINHYLACMIDLKEVEGLSLVLKNRYYKIAVYVPVEYKDVVMDEMAKEGAGFVGQYSHCFFATEGQGCFMAHEGSSPFIGEIGKIQRVREVKLESIVPEDRIKNVVRAMLKAHPYEEVAYDLIELKNDISSEHLGVIGKRQVGANELIEEVKNKLKISNIRAYLAKDVFCKIAILSGSGKDYIRDAYFKGADCLITGEIGHHAAIMAKGLNLSIIELGHYESEKVFVDIVFDILSRFDKKDKINIIKSSIDTNYVRLF